MPNLVKRRVKGKQYFYLESTIRIEKKVQKISVYLGKIKPTQESIKIKEKELEKKIESFLYGYFGKDLNKYTSSFLTNEQLLEAEILKKKYFDRIKKLSRQQKEA